MTKSSQRAHLREKASSDDAEACWDLYRHLGKHNPIRKREAANWCRKAAVQGHLWAQGWLGFCHDQGIGVPRNGRQALYWWRRAARGLASWKRKLARAHARGIGTARDLRKADELCRRASTNAMYSLGSSHLGGRGVKRSPRQAYLWFRKAAELGDTHAAIRISDLILGGEVALHLRESVRWIRRAAEAGDPSSQVHLGNRLCEGEGVRRNRVEALRWYGRAAKQGDEDAWHNLGQMYRLGEGVVQSWPRALACYRQAARRGCSTSIYWLFSYYEGDEGAPRNARLASVWLRRLVTAARKGAAEDDAECLFLLGILHFNGQGVKPDERRVAELYRRAADLENARAAYYLGLCYRDGYGVRRDRRAARAWLERALRRGERDAGRALLKLARDPPRLRRG